jgi:hypothetical protein
MTVDWKAKAQEARDTPGWHETAERYQRDHGLIVQSPPEGLTRSRRLMRNDVSLDRAWNEINRIAGERYNQAPKATYEAAVFELRTHGVVQLNKPNCQRRLANLSLSQFKCLMASLQQKRDQYPNISDELLAALEEIYDARVMADA